MKNYSLKEQLDLYEEYLNGNLRARDLLIQSFEGLAKKLASNFSKRYRIIEYEDFLQEAKLAMVERFDKYNRKHSFSTFFYIVISNQLKNMALGRKYFIVEALEGKSLNLKRSTLDQPMPARVDLQDYEENNEQQEEVEEVLSFLSEKNKFYIKKLYGIGYNKHSYQELSEESGEPIHKLRKIVKNSIKSLRKKYIDE